MVEEENSQVLLGLEATRFRAAAARANDLDTQYAVKEICRKIAKPVDGDWQNLTRLGRYLEGAPRCAQCYEWQEGGKDQTGCSDSDRAGCRTAGKSTRGGLTQLGSHLLKS